MKVLTSLSLLVAFIYGQNNTESWKNCLPCRCYSRLGIDLKSADCAFKPRVQLSEVPKNLSSEIEVIDLGKQNITVLKNFEFSDAKLWNLKKIWMYNCQISEVDKDSMRNLTELQEIVLSGNEIEEIKPGTFQDNINLERIYLRKNKLKKIVPNVFSNLEHLSFIDLSSNSIENIEKDSFKNNLNLTEIKLDDNKLKILNQEIFLHLNTLTTLSLFNNPWYCTCALQYTINSFKDKNLLTSKEICDFPENLRGKALVNLSFNDLNCLPKVLLKPDVGVKFVSSGENLTLSCEIYNNMDFYWTFNKQPTSNCMESFICNNNYVKMESHDFGDFTMVNITKNNVSSLDSGLYGCYAQNRFGLRESFIAVIVSDHDIHENEIHPPKEPTTVVESIGSSDASSVSEKSLQMRERKIPVFPEERDMERPKEFAVEEDKGYLLTLSYIVLIGIFCLYSVFSTGFLVYYRYRYKAMQNNVVHHYEEIRHTSYDGSVYYNRRNVIGEPQDFRRMSDIEDGPDKIYLEPKPKPRIRTSQL